MQLQALPRVLVQNSSLEVAWTRVLRADPPSIAGTRIAPLLTEGFDGFSIDYPDDAKRAVSLVESGEVDPWRPET
jgi:N-acylneuraminate cytidylyltransferase